MISLVIFPNKQEDITEIRSQAGFPLSSYDILCVKKRDAYPKVSPVTFSISA